ncbi:MAG: DoxX family protein [Anaerolineae bacterium]
MNIVLILKILVSLIFVAAAFQKWTGKVAPDWTRWGYSEHFMRATSIAEIVAVVLLWWPGLTMVGAALMALILLGALVTLIRHHESASHIALPGMTLIMALAILYVTYAA